VNKFEGKPLFVQVTLSISLIIKVLDTSFEVREESTQKKLIGLKRIFQVTPFISFASNPLLVKWVSKIVWLIGKDPTVQISSFSNGGVL
jgi:hypothetical protein